MIKLITPQYPSGINAEDFTSVCPDFEDELRDILERSGNKAKFIKLFNLRTDWVRSNKSTCHQKRDWCEQLKHDPEHYLYSLKIKNNQNIRILFIFYGETMLPILLCAFTEIGKGGNSSKAYEQYIPIAHKRVNALIENGLIKKEEIVCHN
ncbi:MAG: hypothetical protein ACI4DP_10985 [Candidatus Ornithomonoglobus sp.]